MPNRIAPNPASAPSTGTIVASPNRGSGANALNAVAMVSGSDIWADGYSDNTGTHQTLIERCPGARPKGCGCQGSAGSRWPIIQLIALTGC